MSLTNLPVGNIRHKRQKEDPKMIDTQEPPTETFEGNAMPSDVFKEEC